MNFINEFHQEFINYIASHNGTFCIVGISNETLFFMFII